MKKSRMLLNFFVCGSLLLLTSCATPSRYNSQNQILQGTTKAGPTSMFVFKNTEGKEEVCQGNETHGYADFDGGKIEWLTNGRGDNIFVALRISDHGKNLYYVLGGVDMENPSIVYSSEKKDKNEVGLSKKLKEIVNKFMRNCTQLVGVVKKRKLGEGDVYNTLSGASLTVRPHENADPQLGNLIKVYGGFIEPAKGYGRKSFDTREFKVIF